LLVELIQRRHANAMLYVIFVLQTDVQTIGAFAVLTLIPLIVLSPTLAFGRSRGRRCRTPITPRIGLPVPASLPAEAQWSRVTKIVETTHFNARKASEHHAMAGLKLDAAEYAFRRMLEELNPVVARPLTVSAIPPSAEVRVFASPAAALAA
jgi:hypothetical protein